MKTVYRVEHSKYRHGPYRAGEPKTKACKKLATKLQDEMDRDLQPPPSMDGIGSISNDLHCGFDSLDALFDWFDRWLKELTSHDYHIVVFNVDEEDVITGRKQIVFRRKKYRRVKALPMTHEHERQQ